MQVLRGLIQAFKLLADAPAAPVSAGMDLLNAQRQVSSQQVQSTAASLAFFDCLLIRHRRDLNNTGGAFAGVQLWLECLVIAPWPCVSVIASHLSLVPMPAAEDHCHIFIG